MTVIVVRFMCSILVLFGTDVKPYLVKGSSSVLSQVVAHQPVAERRDVRLRWQ